MNDSILNQQRLYLMTSPKSSYQDFYQIIKVVLPGSIRRQTLLGLEPFGDLLLEKLRHYVRKFKSNLLQT